ncbi:putative hydrolase of the HAD superfamily [Pedobacter sp. CAN_A7]|uniref:HAD family hydrolase n=1 Tax=Pedobacter sp. CAN_A7 TaxID=2787722 RepID=UPI0018CABD0A
MKINHKLYHHISFDLWLTLIRSNPEFKGKRNLLFRDFFEIDASMEEVTQVIRYYDVLCNKMNEKTGLNINTYEIYYFILNKLNVDISEVSLTQLDQFYKETETLFFAYKPQLMYPGIDRLFEELKSENKSMNILSNTGFIKGKTLRKLMTEYGFEQHFDFQIYSDEVGVSKPNLEIFKLVDDQVKKNRNLEQKDVVHVGDNIIADYNGAKSYGFGAILLNT